MKKRLLSLPVFAFLFCAWIHGIAFPTGEFRALNLGGGGEFTGFDFSCDGAVKTTRNDTGDGWTWRTDRWVLMNSYDNTVNIVPLVNRNGIGVTAVGASCSENIVLMRWGGFILRSTDGGLTFQQTNFPVTNYSNYAINSGLETKSTNPRIAFDPNNNNIVYYCDALQGLYKSIDKGVNWNLVTGVPAAMPVASFTTRTASGGAGTTLNLTVALTAEIGSYIFDETNPGAIPPNTVVLSGSGTTAIVTNNDMSGVVASDTIRIAVVSGTTGATNAVTAAGNSVLHFAGIGSLSNPGVGWLVYNRTHPDTIPVGTYLAAMPTPTNSTLTMSANATGAGVSSGDTIVFINTVANGNGDATPGCVIAIDPSSASGGISQIITIGPANRGLWQSTDGGSTWGQLGGSAPTTATFFNKMRYSSNGTLWLLTRAADVTAGNSNFWKLKSGTWTRFTTAQLSKNDATNSFAVDPADPAHVVLGPYLAETLNEGVTWSAQNFGPQLNPAGGADKWAADVPWLENMSGIIVDGDMLFDAGASNKVYLADGVGIWWANPPGSHAAFNWNSQTAGTENMTTQRVISIPGALNTIAMAVWDKMVFMTNPLWSATQTYPSIQKPTNYTSIIAAWDIDWVSSQPSTICVYANWAGQRDGRSGCSADLGQTWIKFPADPDNPRVEVASNAASGQPSFDAVSVPGTLLTAASGGTSYSTAIEKDLTTTAGSNITDNFYHFGSGNIPSDISTSWLVGNGTVQAAPHTFLGNLIFGFNQVSCVNFTGADCVGTGAGDITYNGSRFASVAPVSGQIVPFTRTGILASGTLSSIASNTLTLSANLLGTLTAGSIVQFSNVSGNGGGSIAAATPNNIIMVPSNNKLFPYYTKDGGTTWNKVIIADATNCTGGGACNGFNADGSAILEGGSSGWGISYFINTKLVAADRVDIGTFYLWNCRTPAAGGGLYRSTDGGDTWEKTYNAVQIATCGAGSKITTVPGHAGHVYIGGGTSSNRGIYKTTNGGADMALVTGTGPPTFNFTLGAIKPGTSYPALYVVGTIGGVLAYYKATNADTATPTFVNIAAFGKAGTGCMDGDWNTYGRIYTCVGGRGFMWGDFPYLLNRDLNHDNDNTPAFINKAA